MTGNEAKEEIGPFERALRASTDAHYDLYLYVAGAGSRSLRAIRNIRHLCEQHLAGRYDLTIIDAYQQPELVYAEKIIALPLLVRRLPDPVRRLIGDLSETEHVLHALDLVPTA